MLQKTSSDLKPQEKPDIKTKPAKKQEEKPDAKAKEVKLKPDAKAKVEPKKKPTPAGRFEAFDFGLQKHHVPHSQACAGVAHQLGCDSRVARGDCRTRGNSASHADAQ